MSINRRNTRTKQLVLNVLNGSSSALCHEEIKQWLTEKIGRVTIYRILNGFCDEGRLRHRKQMFGWLLAAILVLPFVAKTVHVATCCEHEVAGKTHHHCDDCPVCRFVFSLFIENETFECSFTPQYFVYQIFTFDDKLTCNTHFSYNLRAPPAF
jgi:hypothetical protein